MKKIKFLLAFILMFGFLGKSLRAQIPNPNPSFELLNFDCVLSGETECNDEVGEVPHIQDLTDLTYDGTANDGIISFFEFIQGDEHYLFKKAYWTDDIKDVYTDNGGTFEGKTLISGTDANNNAVNPQFFCANFISTPVTMKLTIVENAIGITNSENFYSFRIWEVHASGDIQISGTMSSNTSTGTTFIPKSNTLYKLSAYVEYDGKPPVYVEMHFCVGPLGDGSGGVYKPVIVDYDEFSIPCTRKGMIVQNQLPGWVYYWDRDPDDIDLNSSTNSPGNEGKAYTSWPGNWYVKGYHPESGSWTEASDAFLVEITNQPEVPIVTSNHYLCSCNPIASAIPGDGGTGVNWYKHPGGNSYIPWEGNPNTEFLLDNVLGQPYSLASVNDEGCLSALIDLDYELLPCDACTGEAFSPTPGNKYVLSAWVKEGDEDFNSIKANYDATTLRLNFTGNGLATSMDFQSSGNLVDGWQKIEVEFVIPAGTEAIEFEFINSSVSTPVFFDDVRIHPFNASMISYVYDQETMQLKAELDENNYYVEYTYDVEGNLIKTNVETSAGVRTVAETRSHIKK